MSAPGRKAPHWFPLALGYSDALAEVSNNTLQYMHGQVVARVEYLREHKSRKTAAIAEAKRAFAIVNAEIQLRNKAKRVARKLLASAEEGDPHRPAWVNLPF